jgi:adenine-specific DNA-methyltransferase
MKSHSGIDAELRPFVAAVREIIRDYLRTDATDMEPEVLYTGTLHAVIERLLGRFDQRIASERAGRQLDLFDLDPAQITAKGLPVVSSIGEGLEPLTPQEVGRLYELLRSFRLEVGPAHDISLVPCARGKRNYGLFYTPLRIVEHIVRRTLDALPVAEPVDYLDLKILDPAVGTGAFLAQALEELSSRVLRNGLRTDRPGQSRIEEIREIVSERAREQGMRLELTIEEALRIFIMSRCLYGVDVDPIAVKISRAVLLESAFKRCPLIPGFEPNIRVGNALVGEAAANPSSIRRPALDRQHAAAYFGRNELDTGLVHQWRRENQAFHWPLEFPEAFARDPVGFDAVIGNPPYEVLSVKESGILDRRGEQAYFRRTYRTCRGKINTYRLMLERGLALLRNSGTLGFIVPTTLLADSTAENSRRMMLDETCVIEAVIVPESAQVFKGVTQAFLILITRKEGRTDRIQPVLWNGEGPIPSHGGVEIKRSVIEKTDFRIPLIKSSEEKALLEILTRHSPFRGDARCPQIGRVHQGEINLTVHREFITSRQTAHPLIRGEHVTPLQLVHPMPGGHRLDWVLPEFLHHVENRVRNSFSRSSKRDADTNRASRGKPWLTERIAVGRVVNMEAERRLKAALVPPGAFLGDMTNSITELTAPLDYVLALLNSTLLNWRFKLTSTNNYLSAAEIEALPMLRVADGSESPDIALVAHHALTRLLVEETHNITGYVRLVHESLKTVKIDDSPSILVRMIRSIVDEIARQGSGGTISGQMPRALRNLLDAVVLIAYGADSYAPVIDDEVK